MYEFVGVYFIQMRSHFCIKDNNVEFMLLIENPTWYVLQLF